MTRSLVAGAAAPSIVVSALRATEAMSFGPAGLLHARWKA